MITRERLIETLQSVGLSEDHPFSVSCTDATGEILCATGGHWPDGRTVTPDDCFYGASLTKQITGAAIALLVRDGVIEPDQLIDIWLPQLPAWSKGITIRHLLHHTSGLPAAGLLESRVEGSWTREAALGSLASTDVLRPGSYAYSNIGYILLADIVGGASGENLAGFAERRLGVAFARDILQMPQRPMLEHLPLSLGDGGLWTRPKDFAAWLHRSNCDAYGIEPLVTAPGPGARDYGWGLGIRSFRGNPLFIHGGSWQRAYAKSARCPALGISVVAMTSAESNEPLLALVEATLELLAGSGEDAVAHR